MPFCIKKKKKIIEALYISSNKESQDYLFKLLIIVNHYWTAKEDNLDTIFFEKKKSVGEGRGELFMNFVNYCLATYT